MGCELGNLCWFYWLEIGWMEFVKNGRFTRVKSPRGRIVVYAMPKPVWISHKQCLIGTVYEVLLPIVIG